ncbi:MAG: DNA-protecting protein DprA [Candidatus Latescibacteria bacterium]|nr:DNA-protecting protein DprA [bacterium]MBD3425474.1 DNA-protecting protein DprA [Candidatus Latescibacterota bacterium]
MAFTPGAEIWLRLLSIRGVSASDWLVLRKRYSASRLLEMAESGEGIRDLSRLTGTRITGPDNKYIDRHLRAASKNMLEAVSIEDDSYPVLLGEIPDPPVLLFYRGKLPEEEKLMIAVVGSRSAGRRGLVNARRIGSELSGRGVTVVSGLARGIDTEAHLGALEGSGGTVAVTGCGLDIPYPPENSGLAIDICRNGSVLSEYPLGTPPLKHHFPRRNRILSGLSRGVVVVEAGIRSGAMITARWAADQGRDVFAVPGPVEHRGSAGPHRLIKEGATLVENAEDILGFIDPFSQIPEEIKIESIREKETLDGLEGRVMDLLELEPVHVDIIAGQLDIAAEEVMAILLNLEISGCCRSLGGGLFAIESRYA